MTHFINFYNGKVLSRPKWIFWATKSKALYTLNAATPPLRILYFYTLNQNVKVVGAKEQVEKEIFLEGILIKTQIIFFQNNIWWQGIRYPNPIKSDYVTAFFKEYFDESRIFRGNKMADFPGLSFLRFFFAQNKKLVGFANWVCLPTFKISFFFMLGLLFCWRVRKT